MFASSVNHQRNVGHDQGAAWDCDCGARACPLRARSRPQLRTIISRHKLRAVLGQARVGCYSARAGPTHGPIGQACAGPDRVPRGASLADSALPGRARVEPTQRPRGQDLDKPRRNSALCFIRQPGANMGQILPMHSDLGTPTQSPIGARVGNADWETAWRIPVPTRRIPGGVRCPAVEFVITKVRSIFPSTGRIFKNC